MKMTAAVEADLVRVHAGSLEWQAGIDLLLDTKVGRRIASDVVNSDGTVQLDKECEHFSGGESRLWEIIRSLLGFNDAKPALDTLSSLGELDILAAALARATGASPALPRW